MTAADDRLLAELEQVGADLAAAETTVEKLKDRRLKLFLRARARSITTTRLAEAVGIPVGNVRQILMRARETT